MDPAAPACAELLERAAVQRDSGDLAGALETLAEAARRHPTDVAARQHLGVMLTYVGRGAEGEAHLRAAVAMSPADPTLRHALALNLMGQGRYPEGWALYDARHEMPQLGLPTPKAFPFPPWRGEDLGGKRIVVFPEQGFGDQIQFGRFVPTLQALGAEVILLTPPPLVRLFEQSFPSVAVLAASGEVSFPDPDVWTMTGALPGRLGATIETLPAAPYLRPGAERQALGDGFKVGLATRGNPRHTNDANRSLPPAAAETLKASLPGQIVDLDPAASGARDFADTAALIAQLDLVVSVDTSVAHLAGALGKRAFVLLPGYRTDWRWMRERSDTPWYPSLTLYRQAMGEDWGPAISRLTADARDLARELGHSP